MRGELIPALPALPALVDPMAILAATRPADFTWLESKRMDTALAIRRVDSDIARIQANRDVSVAQIWARRDVDVARISARRDVDIARIQADRDIAVTRLETHRDVALAHASVACRWLDVRNGQTHFRMASRGVINQTTSIDTW